MCASGGVVTSRRGQRRVNFPAGRHFAAASNPNRISPDGSSICVCVYVRIPPPSLSLSLATAGAIY